MAKISVYGGGAWGQALAFAFSCNQQNQVSIISRQHLTNLPNNIKQVDSKEGKNADFIIISIATFALREWLGHTIFNYDSKIMFASKGIEVNTGSFVSQIAQSFLPITNTCFLCGPSFAAEVIKSLPCALVIHSKNIDLAKQFSVLFPSFIKVYQSLDVIGGEIAGAYKNVIAIAAGMCDGLHLGNNAKASLLARGLVEMSRFGEYFGGEMETFLGLSGAGDLFLTSNSTMSRNYRVGLELAKDKSMKMILENLGGVAEGVLTSQAITQISKQNSIYTPIAQEVSSICMGQKSVTESLQNLMEQK